MNVKFLHNIANLYYLHPTFVWNSEVNNIFSHPVLEEIIVVVRVFFHKSAQNMHIQVVSV